MLKAIEGQTGERYIASATTGNKPTLRIWRIANSIPGNEAAFEGNYPDSPRNFVSRIGSFARYLWLIASPVLSASIILVILTLQFGPEIYRYIEQQIFWWWV